MERSEDHRWGVASCRGPQGSDAFALQRGGGQQQEPAEVATRQRGRHSHQLNEQGVHEGYGQRSQEEVTKGAPPIGGGALDHWSAVEPR